MLPFLNPFSRQCVEQGFTGPRNFHQAYSKRGTGEKDLPRGCELQGPAALLDIQKNPWECPLQGSQLELADLQGCEKAQLLQAKGNTGRLHKAQQSQRRRALIIPQPTISLQIPALQRARAACPIALKHHDAHQRFPHVSCHFQDRRYGRIPEAHGSAASPTRHCRAPWSPGVSRVTKGQHSYRALHWLISPARFQRRLTVGITRSMTGKAYLLLQRQDLTR